MLTYIPKQIDGAKTLFIASSDEGFSIYSPDDEKIVIKFLSINQYEAGSGFYLFGCDLYFNSHTDYFYYTLEEVFEDAKRIYDLDTNEWIRVGD